MGDKCHVCGGKAEVSVKINFSFDKFNPILEEGFVCSYCRRKIVEHTDWIQENKEIDL